MKRIFFIFFCLFFTVVAQAQYPGLSNIGGDSILTNARGGFQGRFINVPFSDTTAANLQRIRQYPGAIIFTSGNNGLWVRNSTVTQWNLLASGGSSTNIYNSNGSLDGPRILSGAGNDLTFTGLGNFNVSASSGIVLGTDATNQLSITSGIGANITLTTPELNFIGLPQSASSADSVLVRTPGGIVKTRAQSAISGSDWTLTGNSGTTAGTNFIGTTDAIDFVIKSNATERLRILSAGNVGIGDATPASLFTVGSGDLFQVNSSGDLVKLKNVTYSWPSSQGSASTVLTNDGNGNLSWAAGGGGAQGIYANSLVDNYLDSLRFIPVTLFPNPSAVNVFGNSFTNPGLNASNADSIYWAHMALEWGKETVNNYGLSASGSWRANLNFMANVNTGHTTMSTVMATFNDRRRDSSRKMLNQIINTHKSIFANQYLATYLAANAVDASIVKTGSWTIYTGQSLGARTNNGTYTTTSGDSVVYTFTGRTNVVLGLMGGDSVTQAYASGTAKLYISGGATIADIVIKENQQYSGTSDGLNDNSRGPMCQIFTGLDPNVTYRLKVASTQNTNAFVLDYFGHMVEASSGYPLLWFHPAYMNSTGYATSPSQANTAGMNAVAAVMDSLANAIRGDYPLYVAQTNSYYSVSTGLSGDNIHPNDVGMRQISDAGLAVLPNVNLAGTNGTILFSGSHFYGTIGGELVELDNNLTIGSTIVYDGTDTRVFFQDGTNVGQDGGFRFFKTTDSLLIGGTVQAQRFIASATADVQNAFTLLNSSGNPIMQVGNFPGSTGLLAIYGGNVTPSATNYFLVSNTSNNNAIMNATTSVILRVAGQDTPSEVTVTSTGMGLKNNSPATALHVKGSAPAFRMDDNAGNNAAFYANFTDFAILSVNRNPGTGVFVNTSKAGAQINLNGAAADGSISLLTSAANNTTPTTGLKVTKDLETLIATVTDNGAFTLQNNGAFYTVGTISAGTTTTNAKVNILSTTEQTRVLYDASNYFSTTIASTGSATLNLVGTSPTFTFSDPVFITTISNSSTAAVSVDGTQTLTNKRITSRVATTASTSSLTIASDDVDMYTVTALAANLTINAPSGTPTNGQKLIIRLTDNGTGRTLTWNAAFRAFGTALPTTTTANLDLYIGAIWNSTASTWDVTSVVEELGMWWMLPIILSFLYSKIRRRKFMIMQE